MTVFPKKILIATKNQGKVKEIKDLLCSNDLNFDVRSLSDLNITDEYEETGSTFKSNAIGKSQFYSEFAKDRLTIADDSGLMVKSLDNRPGVLSARYSGINAKDEDNNKKILEELLHINNRSAKFVTSISISIDGKLIKTFTGEVKGNILTRERGDYGFGYDPLFYYPQLKKTFAELSVEIKNNISHRSKAIKKMIDFLKTSY